MKQYLELVKHILENGQKKEDRTNTGTLSVFGYQNGQRSLECGVDVTHFPTAAESLILRSYPATTLPIIRAPA